MRQDFEKREVVMKEKMQSQIKEKMDHERTKVVE